jgi:hypothetical protein
MEEDPKGEELKAEIFEEIIVIMSQIWEKSWIYKSKVNLSPSRINSNVHIKTQSNKLLEAILTKRILKTSSTQHVQSDFNKINSLLIINSGGYKAMGCHI